jgi:hypothetical protein
MIKKFKDYELNEGVYGANFMWCLSNLIFKTFEEFFNAVSNKKLITDMIMREVSEANLGTEITEEPVVEEPIVVEVNNFNKTATEVFEITLDDVSDIESVLTENLTSDVDNLSFGPKPESNLPADIQALIGTEITAEIPMNRGKAEGITKGKIADIQINPIKKNTYKITLDNGERVAWTKSLAFNKPAVHIISLVLLVLFRHTSDWYITISSYVIIVLMLSGIFFDPSGGRGSCWKNAHADINKID